MFLLISDFEVYLKTKIAEVNISNDDGRNYYSDPNEIIRNLVGKSRAKPLFHPIDSISAQKSVTNESKASVYYTPNDFVDQPQLQLSPMHINIIQEDLNTFDDCWKPSESICKLDFNMHRLEANLKQEIERRRRRFCMQSEDDDDESIEIDTEKTRMLNQTDDDMAINPSQGYIRLNTLPKRNKYKRTLSGKDFYYSLENVFDQNIVDNKIYEKHLPNKTIDEASETQMTSSVSDNRSDNSSTNNMSRSNPICCEGSEGHRNPSHSVLLLNEMPTTNHNEIQTSNSMPNISKTEHLTKEQICLNDDKQCTVVDNIDSQLDQMLPN